MIDTISEVSRSFESGFSVNMNSERRSSINGSYDESLQSLNSKVGLLQRFTEIEGMHPIAVDPKMLNKRRKKFTGAGAIKEIRLQTKLMTTVMAVLRGG
jgi:hypothetical protein